MMDEHGLPREWGSPSPEVLQNAGMDSWEHVSGHNGAGVELDLMVLDDLFNFNDSVIRLPQGI